MATGDIDLEARARALSIYALPVCCHVPIAARTVAAIEQYVGRASPLVSSSEGHEVLLVERYDPPPPNRRLPIWAILESAVLHQSRQVWVHVDFAGYRAAYSRAFPKLPLNDLVLDHVLNRRMARAMGFAYLRIVPISRAANSSSGGLPERWGAEHHATPDMVAANRQRKTFIQYADLEDLVKMLNRTTGGGLQDAVNAAQSLVREPPQSAGR